MIDPSLMLSSTYSRIQPEHSQPDDRICSDLARPIVFHILMLVNLIPSLPALNERLYLTRREMHQMDPEMFERSINLIRFKTSYNVTISFPLV
jgi:hypothetical protein